MDVYHAAKCSPPQLVNRLQALPHFSAEGTIERLGSVGEVEATSASLPLTCPLSKYYTEH